jgi:tripartite-type tricarboxylate transporter receptor subunit TctC
VADIRFIIPFGREGAADRAARIFAAAWTGADLVLENIPGAGGLAGVRRANALARSGASVLLLATPSTHVLLPARLGKDAAPLDKFVPLLGLGFAPNVLLVSPALGVGTLKELLVLARAEALTYASAGAGQTIHVCSAFFCALAGIAMEHRPYDGGSATAYDDLIAGRVHVYFDNLLGCRERIAQGEAIPLAVCASERSPMLPEVPTLIELGFPQHALDVWLGIFGACIDDASKPASESLACDSRLRERLAAAGLSGGALDATVFAQVVADSGARWRRALASTALLL